MHGAGFRLRRPVGKGEVGSSILLGSTTQPHASRGFQRSIPTYSNGFGAVLARMELSPRPQRRPRPGDLLSP